MFIAELLDQIPNDLPPIGPSAAMAHMNPERGGGTGRTLLDQLIEGEMIPHPTEPGLAGLRIRHTDVGRFTLQML